MTVHMINHHPPPPNITHNHRQHHRKAFLEIQAAEKSSAEKSLDAGSKAITDAFSMAALELERRRLPPDQQQQQQGGGGSSNGQGSGGGDEDHGGAAVSSLGFSSNKPNPATQSIVGLRLEVKYTNK